MEKCKRKNGRIWAAFLLLLILCLGLLGATLLNYHMERERCF